MSAQTQVIVIVILLISSFPLAWLGNFIISKKFKLGRKRKAGRLSGNTSHLKRIIPPDSVNPKIKASNDLTESIIYRVFKTHMNDFRTTKGLKPFRENLILSDIAQKWADYQASLDQYLAHNDFEKRAAEICKRLCGQYSTGENCAMNQGTLNPAWVAFDGLIHSKGHRINILTFNTCGTGIAKSKSNTYYFVQLFANI